MEFWLFIGTTVAIVLGVFGLIIKFLAWLSEDYDEYDPKHWD